MPQCKWCEKEFEQNKVGRKSAVCSDACRYEVLKQGMRDKHPRTTVKFGVGAVCNDLTVVEFVGRNEAKQPLWRCECKCGNKAHVTTQGLLSGKKVQTCGCAQRRAAKALCTARSDGWTGKPIGPHGAYVAKPTDQYKTNATGTRDRIFECVCPCGTTYHTPLISRKWWCSYSCPARSEKLYPNKALKSPQEQKRSVTRYHLAGKPVTSREIAEIAGKSLMAVRAQLHKRKTPEELLVHPGRTAKPIRLGDVFGRLTVIEQGPLVRPHGRRWFCSCSCGTARFLVRQMCLRNGSTVSCGCGKREASAKSARERYKDWANTQLANGVTVIREYGVLRRSRRWLCKCTCGSDFVLTREQLVDGKPRWCNECAERHPRRGPKNVFVPLRDASSGPHE